MGFYQNIEKKLSTVVYKSGNCHTVKNYSYNDIIMKHHTQHVAMPPKFLGLTLNNNIDCPSLHERINVKVPRMYTKLTNKTHEVYTRL